MAIIIMYANNQCLHVYLLIHARSKEDTGSLTVQYPHLCPTGKNTEALELLGASTFLEASVLKSKQQMALRVLLPALVSYITGLASELLMIN